MNGWELSHLTIRPQYAMWTVHLPVPNDPVKVVEEIKTETSELFKYPPSRSKHQLRCRAILLVAGILDTQREPAAFGQPDQAIP